MINEAYKLIDKRIQFQYTKYEYVTIHLFVCNWIEAYVCWSVLARFSAMAWTIWTWKRTRAHADSNNHSNLIYFYDFRLWLLFDGKKLLPSAKYGQIQHRLIL